MARSGRLSGPPMRVTLASIQPARTAVMGEIIRFEDRKSRKMANHTVIRKLVDGELIECVNVDVLTPAQLSRYFSEEVIAE
jgi:hypothetical protein